VTSLRASIPARRWTLRHHLPVASTPESCQAFRALRNTDFANFVAKFTWTTFPWLKLSSALSDYAHLAQQYWSQRHAGDHRSHAQSDRPICRCGRDMPFATRVAFRRPRIQLNRLLPRRISRNMDGLSCIAVGLRNATPGCEWHIGVHTHIGADHFAHGSGDRLHALTPMSAAQMRGSQTKATRVQPGKVVHVNLATKLAKSVLPERGTLDQLSGVDADGQVWRRVHRRRRIECG